METLQKHRTRFRGPACTSHKAIRPTFLAILVLSLLASPVDSQVRFAKSSPFRVNAGAPTLTGTPELCKRATTGLVLSGGGAWGLAHVGLIKALDEAGVRPDFIVGTSMGAIIGATYAYGYTGAQIEELVLDFPLQEVFSGYQPELPQPLDDLPVLLLLKQETGGKLSLQAPLAQQALAEKLIRTALSEGAQGGPASFLEMEIPLHVIGTDIETREVVTLSDGDVTRAVLASSAIPLVFPPVEIGGRILVDGGLGENIPVEAARSLGAERIIISDVADRLEKGSLDLQSPTGMALALTFLLFGQEEYEVGSEDVLVRPDLKGQPKLEFGLEQKRALIQIGYEAGVESLKGALCLPKIPQNTPDPQTARGLPHLSGPSVWPLEGGPRQTPLSPEGLHQFTREEDGIQHYLFNDLPYGPMAPGDLKNTSNPKLRSALTLPPKELILTPKGIPMGHRFVGVGGSWDQELGGSVWMGLIGSGLLGGRATGSGVGVVGHQRTELEMSVRGMTDQSSGIWPLVSGHFRDEKIRQFGTSGIELHPWDARSVSGFLGPEARFGRGWVVRGGVKFDAWSDPTTTGTVATAGAELTMEKSAPKATEVHLEATWAAEYTRLAAETEWPIKVGNGTLSPSVRLGLGTDLPTHKTFALGGDLGFPGLHTGEKRGSREALIRVKADYPFVGPLRIRADVAYGATDGGPSDRRGNTALLGVGAGVGMDTVVGPIEFGYGRTGTGRGSWVFRVGRVF